MTNLLVIGSHSDKDFKSCDYVFLSHLVEAQRAHFDNVLIVALTPYVPRFLSPLRRLSARLDGILAKRDFVKGNVKVVFAPYPPWVGRLGLDRLIRLQAMSVRRVLRREAFQFDLVHAHMSPFVKLGVDVAQRSGKPVVATVHDSHDWMVSNLQTPVINGALRECDALIRVNPLDIEELESATDGNVPIHYIPNGFDDSMSPSATRAELLKKHALPDNRPIFVSVARWIERKDPLILLDAMNALRPLCETMPLLCLIGEDPSGGRIEVRVKEHGLEQDVLLLGQKSPQEVLEYMRASTAVLLYSRSEGNPTVMFEALGCGRPYIGSDVGGVSSIISDPRLGRFGPAGDLDALTRLLQEAIETPWDESFIADYARRFSWTRIAERTYEEVYRSVDSGLPQLR